MRQPILRGALLLIAAVAAMAAQAQTERGGGESSRIIQQYQQLAGEKTALQAQLAQMKKDLDAAQADLASAKNERDALKAHAAGSAALLEQMVAGKDAADKGLEQSRQHLSELVAKFRETVATLKDAEAARDKSQSELAARSSAFDKCAQANVELYRINGEVLDRYEHVGFFTKLGAANPFVRTTRAQIENLVDEYRARAQQLSVGRASQ